MLWIAYDNSTDTEINDILEQLYEVTSCPICAYERETLKVSVIDRLPDSVEQPESTPYLDVWNKASPEEKIKMISVHTPKSVPLEPYRTAEADVQETDLVPDTGRVFPDVPRDHHTDDERRVNKHDDEDEAGSVRRDDGNRNEKSKNHDQTKDQAKSSSQTNAGQCGATDSLGNLEPSRNKAGGNKEDHGDDGDDKEPTLLVTKDPQPPPEWRQRGTFTGETKLTTRETEQGKSIGQSLLINFGMTIDPTYERGAIDCGISLNSLLVNASNLVDDDNKEIKTIGKVPAEPFYVNETTLITFVPTGKCSPPAAQDAYPLQHQFIAKQTSTRTASAELDIQFPKLFTFKGTAGGSRAVEQPQILVAMEPIHIRNENQQDMQWYYKIHKDFETRLQLSQHSPLVHRATYTVLPHSHMPENFKVRIDSTFRRNALIPRLISSGNTAVPTIFKYLEQICAYHIIMTLEATIGREEDFRFPTEQKGGFELEMELKCIGGSLTGTLGLGIPVEKQFRGVKSMLGTVAPYRPPKPLN